MNLFCHKYIIFIEFERRLTDKKYGKSIRIAYLNTLFKNYWKVKKEYKKMIGKQIIFFEYVYSNTSQDWI